MRLYVRRKEIAAKKVGAGGVRSVPADIRIGKAGIMRMPTEALHDTSPSEYGLDGLIDEVRIYKGALGGGQVAESCKNFHPGPAVAASPDMQKRALPEPTTGGAFKTVYTHLPYYETWENMWRFGSYPDVVVGFDRLPVTYVFWRGVSYIPMIVNEKHQWYTNEFNETSGRTAPGDNEPMSDKGCWNSHVRIIENTPARAVIHWRYWLSNPDHHWANYDAATGWGDIADWYYYIYPDGVAAKRMRCYTSQPKAWYEWQETIAILGEGQHPESVLAKSPVLTLVDEAGKAVITIGTPSRRSRTTGARSFTWSITKPATARSRSSGSRGETYIAANGHGIRFSPRGIIGQPRRSTRRGGTRVFPTGLRTVRRRTFSGH